jgi:squalene synthase HpnC
VERVGSPPAATELSHRAASRSRHENFPVALWLLPRSVRAQLRAVYGFARLADDLGDEAAGDRRALLDWLDQRLDELFGDGSPSAGGSDPVWDRLVEARRALALPEEPFRRLVEANRRDQVVSRYATWAELEEYCSYSADPVGRLVLAIFRATSPERAAWSDRVCTGLQLVEHLQDVGEDLGRGRVYLPAEDLDRFGCSEADLRAASASEAVRAVVAFEVARARGLLDAAGPLVASLSGRARWAVAGFAAGGLAALDAIERAGGDVLAVRCRPRRRDVLRHAVSLRRRAGRGRS